jgi:hypothetical protein
MLIVTNVSAAPAPAIKSIDPPQNILFVGNSFTYYNNSLHNHVRKMMQAGDHEVGRTRIMTISGGKLSEHAAALPAMVASEDWDVVILQGHSLEAVEAESVPEFRQAVRDHNRVIRESGAETVLFMTWARTHLPEQTMSLNDNYTSTGNEAESLVVPVGLAFEKSTHQKNSIALRIADRRHPTLAGTYLAACTFYAALLGESPVGNSYSAGLDEQTAATLQQIAWETVTDYYGIE